MRSGNYLDLKQPTYTDATLDCSANPDFPAGTAGMRVLITAAGKVGGASGLSVAESDFLICLTGTAPTGDYASVGSHWNLVMPEMDMSNLRVVDLFVADSATFGDAATFTSAVTFSDTATCNGEFIVNNTATFNAHINATSLTLSDTATLNGELIVNNTATFNTLVNLTSLVVSDTTTLNGELIVNNTATIEYALFTSAVVTTLLTTGWSGTFLNGESSTVTVLNGIITDVS